MLGSSEKIFQLIEKNGEIVTGEVSIFTYYNYYIDTKNFIFGLVPFDTADVIMYTTAHRITANWPITGDAFNIVSSKWYNQWNGSAPDTRKGFRTLRKEDL